MNFIIYVFFSFMSIMSSSMLNYVIWFSILSILFYFLVVMLNPIFFGDFPTKYFIQEAISSVILLLGLIMGFWLFYLLALMMKLAMPPFQGWFLDLVKKTSFYQISIMLTVHKLYPLFFCFMIMEEVFLNFLFIMLFFTCLFFVTKFDLKELVVYSSFISSIWILIMGFYVLHIMFIYMMYILIISFLFYIMFEYYPINPTFMFCVFLVSGLPPTIIWFLKIIMMSSMNFNYLLILSFMSGLSIYLYFYVFSNQFLKNQQVINPTKKLFLWFPFFLTINLLVF